MRRAEPPRYSGIRRLRTAVLIGAAMLCQSSVYALTPGPEPSVFDVRFLRVEGASVGLRRAADTVYEIGTKIRDSSRLGNVAALRSAADDLHTETTATLLALAALEAELTAPRVGKNPPD